MYLKNDKTAVVSSKGTDPYNPSDVMLDLLHVSTNNIKDTSRYYDLKNVVNNLISQGYTVTTTGHSLGSVLSREIVSDTGANRGILFSEPQQLITPSAINNERITRVVGASDLLRRRDVTHDIVLEDTGHSLYDYVGDYEDD